MNIICQYPVKAYIYGKTETGADRVRFDLLRLEQLKAAGLRPREFFLPCGKCVGCLKKRRDDMTSRLIKEADMAGGYCSFLTLTYNDDSMPITDGNAVVRSRDCVPDFRSHGIPTLHKKDVQDFIKRLRRRIDYHEGFRRTLVHDSCVRAIGCRPGCTAIRYVVAGEYGKLHIRPHFHILVFGFVPPDLLPWKRENSYWLYRSSLIEQLWPHGFSTVGFGNGAVGRYCAKYLCKDGVATDPRQVKECLWSSNRSGGIGKPWFDVYGNEAMARGYMVNVDRRTLADYKLTIPAYFKRLFRSRAPLCYEAWKRHAALFQQGRLKDDKWLVEQQNAIRYYLANLHAERRPYEDAQSNENEL